MDMHRAPLNSLITWIIVKSSATTVTALRTLFGSSVALFPPTLCKCLVTVPFIILSSVSLTLG